MRNRFQDFMYGRYGSDQLSRFTCIVALIVLVVGWFVPFSGIMTIIALVLLVISYFRMFSRDISKRSLENEKFLDITSRFRRGGGYSGGYSSYGNSGNSRGRSSGSNFERAKKERQQRKDYRFYNCPHCNQRVRVPKGKGKICITCPKCRTEFVKRS